MKKALLLFAALGLALVGCKTTGPHPGTPAEDCSTPGGTVPTAPPLQPIPDTGTVPVISGATRHIVTMYCPSTRQYTAAGVDTAAGRFTFVMQGSRATQQAAFDRFYEAGVPVTVYTSNVRLRTRGTPAPAPMTTPPSPAPTPSESDPKPSEGDDSGSGDSGEDGDDGSTGPCINISDKPPTIPTGPGGKDPYEVFLEVVWRTAYAVDGVIEKAGPLTAPGTVPVPR